MVYDNPELVFECKAPTFKASGGSATTVTAASSQVAISTADAFNGGFLVSPKGSKRAITDYAQASSTSTFTVETGETAAATDVYTLYPQVGCAAGWTLTTDRDGLVLSTSGCTMLRVIGHDFDRGMLKLMPVMHSLGVQATDAT